MTTNQNFSSVLFSKKKRDDIKIKLALFLSADKCHAKHVSVLFEFFRDQKKRPLDFLSPPTHVHCLLSLSLQLDRATNHSHCCVLQVLCPSHNCVNVFVLYAFKNTIIYCYKTYTLLSTAHSPPLLPTCFLPQLLACFSLPYRWYKDIECLWYF